MNVALSSLLAVVVCSQVPTSPHQSSNFVVHAETPEIARMVAVAAETNRTDLAKLWQGRKLADWSTPCRINVTITMNAPEAYTDISYSQGKVIGHKVEISGALEEILKGPLPHELTHVFLGHHFGSQAPRWADEGAAILSEANGQATLQRRTFDQILTAKRQFPLRAFLAMRDYPTDMRCLYAQGHSVSRFLVSAKGKPVFLDFVSDGMQRGWDEAVREKYGYKNIEHLEEAWLDSLARERANRRLTLTPHMASAVR
jgi:hypothetical protein